jgi:HSP20 family molecular chaperone IbpA
MNPVSPNLAPQSFFDPQTIIDPALTAFGLGLSCLTEVLSSEPGIKGIEYVTQCGSSVSGGVLEYVRRLTLSNQQMNSLRARSLAIINSNVTTSTKYGKFTVTIPLGAGVKPEDLKVAVKDRELTVSVKGSSDSEDGTARLVQEYTKKITLPEDVQVHQVKTVLSAEGILTIEAPIPETASTRAKVVEIPISNLD